MILSEEVASVEAETREVGRTWGSETLYGIAMGIEDTLGCFIFATCSGKESCWQGNMESVYALWYSFGVVLNMPVRLLHE